MIKYLLLLLRQMGKFVRNNYEKRTATIWNYGEKVLFRQSIETMNTLVLHNLSFLLIRFSSCNLDGFSSGTNMIQFTKFAAPHSLTE